MTPSAQDRREGSALSQLEQRLIAAVMARETRAPAEAAEDPAES